MTRLLRLFAVMAVILMALPALHAAAQEATAESVLDNPGVLQGIQYGISRDWETTADLSTPPAEGESVVLYLAVAVFEFDDDDNADAAFDLLRDDLSTFIGDEFGLGPDEYTTEEDDDEFAAHGEIVQGDESAYFKYVLASDDEYVFITISATTDESASRVANELTEYLEDAEDDHSGLGDFNDDGTSTGGLWDLLPAADHRLLSGLEATSDGILYPEQEG